MFLFELAVNLYLCLIILNGVLKIKGKIHYCRTVIRF